MQMPSEDVQVPPQKQYSQFPVFEKEGLEEFFEI